MYEDSQFIIHGQRNIKLGIRIYSWKISSSGVRIEVFPPSSGSMDNIQEGIVKGLAEGNEWIIYYHGCLISKSLLLLARYKIGSVWPSGGSDWSHSLWTSLHNWPSFSPTNYGVCRNLTQPNWRWRKHIHSKCRNQPAILQAVGRPSYEQQLA